MKIGSVCPLSVFYGGIYTPSVGIKLYIKLYDAVNKKITRDCDAVRAACAETHETTVMIWDGLLAACEVRLLITYMISAHEKLTDL